MTTEVAFPRAVNVAGHASVRMTALKRVFESAGCANVRTYIQSGNVIYDAPRAEAAATRQRIGSGLGKLVGAGIRNSGRTLRGRSPEVTGGSTADARERGGFVESSCSRIAARLLGGAEKFQRGPQGPEAFRREDRSDSRRLAGR